MKKLFFIPIVLVTVLMSCSKDDITGSGNLNSEFREVDYFTKVKSEGVFEVNITQGTTQSVEIIADNNVLNKINTRVVNNELRLYLDDGNYQKINLEVNITVLRLNGLENDGAGNMYAFNIQEEGSFSIENYGSANILIEGSAGSLNIENEGSGNIMAFDFLVNDCNIEIEGSGDVEVSCSDNLNVEIDGSANVYYKGTPTIDTDIRGSGYVIQSN